MARDCRNRTRHVRRGRARREGARQRRPLRRRRRGRRRGGDDVRGRVRPADVAGAENAGRVGEDVLPRPPPDWRGGGQFAVGVRQDRVAAVAGDVGGDRAFSREGGAGGGDERGGDVERGVGVRDAGVGADGRRVARAGPLGVHLRGEDDPAGRRQLALGLRHVGKGTRGGDAEGAGGGDRARGTRAVDQGPGGGVVVFRDARRGPFGSMRDGAGAGDAATGEADEREGRVQRRVGAVHALARARAER
mmetsp:Transcript_13967/g.59153  ORF Transcript_13967/g.59153 Transcript_13967/m.59153 type:complete len:248 (+) Transcript_13967:799-1542(+)